MNEETAEKVLIAGTGISNVSLQDTIAIFNNWIQRGEKKRVCVTPVNCVVWASKDAGLRHIYNTADLTLCDGVPLLWAARLLKHPLKERVTGLDLFPAYIQTCYEQGFSVFFLGAAPGTGELLKSKYESMYPGIRIAGVYSPPFSAQFSAAENQQMISHINAAKPDVLWVSLTAPKQDRWLYEFLPQLDVHIAIGVGGAFDVEAGHIQRAPAFMQRNGLEWLFRFFKEPKRLFNRYFVEAPRFVPLILQQWWRNSRKS